MSFSSSPFGERQDLDHNCRTGRDQNQDSLYPHSWGSHNFMFGSVRDEPCLCPTWHCSRTPCGFGTNYHPQPPRLVGEQQIMTVEQGNLLDSSEACP